MLLLLRLELLAINTSTASPRPTIAFTDKSDYGPSFPAVNALITLSTKAIGEMASVNQDTSTA